MKKVILFLSLLTVMSCSYKDRQVNLGFDLGLKSSKYGKNVGIKVQVFDDRIDSNYVGSKRFGSKTVNITSDESLTVFLRDKISRNLMLKGFSLGKDKLVEVHIQTFAYKAKRGVPVGNSKSKAVVNVVIKDQKTQKEFSKNYVASLTNEYFVSSLAYMDKRNINRLLEELVKDILQDDNLLSHLRN